MMTDKAQTSLHICAVFSEPLLLANISMIVDDYSNQNLDQNMHAKLKIDSRPHFLHIPYHQLLLLLFFIQKKQIIITLHIWVLHQESQVELCHLA